MIVWLWGVAQAAEPVSVVTLAGALVGLGGAETGGLIGSGAIRLNLRDAPVSVEACGREGVVFAGVGRTIGAVGVGARYGAPVGFTARAGFLHHHETPFADWRQAPGAALAGVSEGIVHRSGLEAALGWDFVLPDPFEGRAHGVIEAGGSWFPNPGVSPVYGFVSFGAALDVGKRWPET